MRIFISEADRESAKRIALKNIARFFNLNNWESKSNDELLDDISKREDKAAIEIFRVLKEYFNAYDEWFAFYQHYANFEQGEEYSLGGEEQEELEQLIQTRENTLKQLQKKFDELQLQRLNNKTYGSNVSGIIK
ncbi:MAG: hypothetical protein ACRC9X_01660 [Bacteroidales bacterium]